MAPGAVSVIYPSETGGAPTKFDMDYYLKTHMPLVMKHWGPLGLKGYSISSFPPGAEAPQPFVVQAALQWETQAAVHAAMKHDSSKEVLGDIANFTNAQPTLLVGDEVQRE